MLSRKRILLSGAILSALAIPATASAACKPPAGFVEPPMPKIGKKLVSHIEETVMKVSLNTAVQKRRTTDLQSVIARTEDLPHVTGEYQLSKLPFGTQGTKRYVCLSDGGSLVEQILIDKQTSDKYQFRYQVWGYTSEAAKAVHYAVGEFIYTPVSKTKTNVKWTYSFALKKDQFPGYLGALGRGLFNMSFLQSKYAPLMKGSLANIKKHFEK